MNPDEMNRSHSARRRCAVGIGIIATTYVVAWLLTAIIGTASARNGFRGVDTRGMGGLVFTHVHAWSPGPFVVTVDQRITQSFPDPRGSSMRVIRNRFWYLWYAFGTVEVTARTRLLSGQW